jgi:cytidine deaminase
MVPNSPASRLADKAQGLSSAQRPNTVAVIKHKDGTVTVGRNQGGNQNSTVQNALDNAPANCFAGQCAEINALSRALNKGRSLDGATISVSNVRGAGSTSGVHGTPKTPCTTCSSVLDQLGVKYTQ